MENKRKAIMKKLFRRVLLLLPIMTLLFIVLQGNSFSEENKEDDAGYVNQIKKDVSEQKVDVETEQKLLVLLKKQQAIEVNKANEKKPNIKSEPPQPQKKVVVSRSNGYSSTYEITHYTAYCNGCTGKTASGYNVRNTIYYNGYRIVAAPPSIAFNTKLKITYADGTIINAIVLDRGKDITSKRLDLLVGNKDEAYRLGRQSVKVQIIK